MATIPEKVESKNANIEVEIRKVRHGARPQFENLFGQYALGEEGLSGMNVPVGTIKNLSLKHGLRSITVDSVNKKLDRNDPAASLDKLGDDLLDQLEEEGVDLYNALIRLVVKHNKWLAQEVPFQMVFGRFAPEDQAEGNPTEDSSSTGSTPDSDTPAT